MTPVEEKILSALMELDAAVNAMRTANPKPNLLPLFARIESLAAQMPADSDPELRHFLARRSYEKARAKLEGGAAARGSCGH